MPTMHYPCAKHCWGDGDGGSIIFPRKMLVEQQYVIGAGILCTLFTHVSPSPRRINCPLEAVLIYASTLYYGGKFIAHCGFCC